MTQRYIFYSIVFLLGISTTAIGQNSWTTLNTGFSADLKGVSFLDSRTGFAVGDAGTVLSTTNGGQTWEALSAGCKKPLWVVAAFKDHSAATRVIVAGDDGACCVSSDGGATWSSRTTNLAGGSYIFGIQVVNDSTFYLTGGEAPQSGLVLKTTNFGWTWVKAKDPTPYFFDKTWFVNDMVGYGVGSSLSGSGLIEKTTDGGLNWQTIASSPGLIEGVHAFDANHVIAAGDGSASFVTTNGGRDWTNPSLPVATDYQSMMFRNDRNGVMAGAGVVIITTDGGQSWTDTKYPGLEVLTQAQLLPDGTIYAVAPAGVIVRLAGNAAVTNSAAQHIGTSISLAANPAHNRIVFRGETSSTSHVKLYSVTGKRALDADLSDNSIDCSMLARGIYYYELSEAPGKQIAKGSVVLE